MPLTFGELFTGISGFGLGLERAGMKCVWQIEKDADCNRVLAARFPNVKRYMDVTTIKAEELEPVDLISFGWPCFRGGTLVLTQNGLRPIEDVVVGDMVLTHKGRYCRVTNTMSRQAPTVEMRGYGHPGLGTTPTHPFWSSKRSRVWVNAKRGWDAAFEDPRWMAARDMQGRSWASPMRFPELPIPPIEIIGRESEVPPLTPELFWVIGAWLGDGWARIDARRGQVFICAAYDEADELAVRIEDAGLWATVSNQRTTIRFIISSRPLARWLLENFGHGAAGKNIPAWALGMDSQYRATLLDGYRFADGSDRREGFRVTTISKGLAVSSRLLGLSLGWFVSLYYFESQRECLIEGRTVNEQPQWQVCFCSNPRSAVVINEQQFGLVREITTNDIEETVYDLTVESDESFVADGIIVHNCQDLSVAGLRAGISGERSGLFHEAARIISELRPQWFVAENVPGLFSSYTPIDAPPSDVEIGTEWEVEEDSDFENVLATLTELGYCVSWRVCDAQFWNVAQRRERVFIVGSLGNLGSLEVFPFAESLPGDFETRREARAGTPEVSVRRAQTSSNGMGSQNRRINRNP